MVTPYLQRLRAARRDDARTPVAGLVQARRRSRFEPGPAEPGLSTVPEPLELEVETEARRLPAPAPREHLDDSVRPLAPSEDPRPWHAPSGPPAAGADRTNEPPERRPPPAGGPPAPGHEDPPTARAIVSARRDPVRRTDVESGSGPRAQGARFGSPATESQDRPLAPQAERRRRSGSPSPASSPPRSADSRMPPRPRPESGDHSGGQTADARGRPPIADPARGDQATADPRPPVRAEPKALELSQPKLGPPSAENAPSRRLRAPSSEAVAPLLATAAGLAAEAAGRSRQSPGSPPPAPEIEVTVTIGRLEVRSAPSVSPRRPPSPRSGQRAPSSLDQYLQARSARRLG
jgi:hypothetical protein